MNFPQGNFAFTTSSPRLYSEHKKIDNILGDHLFKSLDFKSVSPKEATPKSPLSQKKIPTKTSTIPDTTTKQNRPKLQSKRILDTNWYIVIDEDGKRYFYNRDNNEMLEKAPPFVVDLMKSKVDHAIKTSIPKQGRSKSQSKKRHEAAKLLRKNDIKREFTLDDLMNVERKFSTFDEVVEGTQIESIEARCYWLLKRKKTESLLDFTKSLTDHLVDKYKEDYKSLDKREIYSLFKLINLRALAYMSIVGEADKAIPYIHMMLEIAPNRYETLCARGELFRHKKNNRQAKADIMKALSLNPDHPNTYIFLSNVYLAEQNFEKSLEVIDQGLKRLKDNYDILVAKIKILVLIGNIKEAFMVTQHCIKLQPKTIDGYISFAQIAIITGNLDTGIPAIQEAIKIDPGSSEAYMIMGHILQEKKSYYEAILAYDVAIKTDEFNIEAREGKVASLFSWEKYDECLFEADALLLKDEKNIVALHFKANCYVLKNNAEQAIGLYREIISQEPHAPHYEKLAMCYRQLGNFEKAMKVCEEGLRKTKDNSLLYAKGIIYQCMNKLDEAMDMYERLIEENPEHMDAKIAKTSIYIAKAEFEEATRYYETYKDHESNPKLDDAVKMSTISNSGEKVEQSIFPEEIDMEMLMKMVPEGMDINKLEEILPEGMDIEAFKGLMPEGVNIDEMLKEFNNKR